MDTSTTNNSNVRTIQETSAGAAPYMEEFFDNLFPSYSQSSFSSLLEGEIADEELSGKT